MTSNVRNGLKFGKICKKVILYINSLMSLRHFDVLTISGYKIFFSTNIYSNKLCNISFERAQNMLYRKK